MKVLLRSVLKIAGVGGMLYAAFIIIKWYIYWLQYYFIGNMKISILAGLGTFFLSPIAAVADLFWHQMPQGTLNVCIQFIIYFIAGRILFFLGERFDDIR